MGYEDGDFQRKARLQHKSLGILERWHSLGYIPLQVEAIVV